MRPYRNHLMGKLLWLSLLCIGLSACAGPIERAIPNTPTIQATEIGETPIKSPPQSDAPTITPTATQLPRATTTPPLTTEPTAATVAPPLEAIAGLLNTTRDPQELDALMTSQFTLHLLPYSSQRLSRSQAVPNLMAHLGSTQIAMTEAIPDGVEVTDWVGDTADFVAYSTGWGINGTVAGLMLFTRQDGEMLWSGLVLSPDNFAPAPELTIAPPPRYLTFQLGSEIFTVADEGATVTFQGEEGDAHAYLISPTNSRVLEMQYNPETPYRVDQIALIDLATGSRQPLELPYRVARFGLGWVDEHTIGMGIWLDEEDALGQTPGRPLVMDVLSGEWTLLADHHATISQVGDGCMVYTSDDEFVVWREDGATAYPLMGDGLPTPSHSERQWILTTGSQFTLVDGEERTELLTYRAFHPQGRFLAPAAWSPDDSWVALRPAPTGLELDGIWLYNVGEGERVYLGAGTANPLWQDGQVVLFNATVAGETELHAYNVVAAERVKVDAPAGSVPLHFAPVGD